MVDLSAIWEEYGLEELQTGVEQLFPKSEFSVEQLMEQLMQGDFRGVFSDLFGSGYGFVVSQLTGIRNIFLWLIVLGIVAAIISRFAESFDRHQVSDMSFYFLYLLFSAILLQCLREAADTAVSTLENITHFIRMLIPAYMLSIGVSAGTTTAGAASQLMFLVIYGVESILSYGVVSLVYSYIMLTIINGIWVEEKLTLLIELMRKGITLVLKGALWVITGLSVFQSLIMPVRDTFRNSVLEKIVRAIPGIGTAASGAVELVIGSAMVIKRCIGAVLLILMLVLCFAPLLKLALIAGALKSAAAFMGLVSDRRLVSCTDRAGDAGLLLLRTTGTAMLLFMIAVAVLSASGRY